MGRVSTRRLSGQVGISCIFKRLAIYPTPTQEVNPDEERYEKDLTYGEAPVSQISSLAQFVHLEQLNLDAAEIDVGSAKHWVCVPAGRSKVNVRFFGCFTPDLQAMAAWLKSCGVTTVAMESTGVYWIPVFQILESTGLEVKLVNAHHLKTVPGPKNDEPIPLI